MTRAGVLALLLAGCSGGNQPCSVPGSCVACTCGSVSGGQYCQADGNYAPACDCSHPASDGGVVAGVSWLKVGNSPFFSRPGRTLVSAPGGLWFISPPEVWTSADGRCWTLANAGLPFFGAGAAVALRDRVYYLPPSSYEAWSSPNGSDWSKLASEPGLSRWKGAAAVFQDRIWVAGGASLGTQIAPTDVWSSQDGATWTRATADWGLGEIGAPGMIGFDGFLWLFGGSNGRGSVGTVYRSADGVQWTRLPDLPFSPREAPAVFVLNGSIWLIGGTFLSPDVWSTKDGVQWLSYGAAPVAPARTGMLGVAFGGSIWLVGGTTDTALVSDVWRSP
jgi:hypothetical protein